MVNWFYLLIIAVFGWFTFANAQSISGNRALKHVNDFYLYPDKQEKKLKKSGLDVNKNHWVFVYGFLNELNPWYFSDNKSALKNFGVHKDLISEFAPSSAIGSFDNSKHVLTRLKKLYKRSEKKLVIFAHSKGAVEVLLTALDNPDFFKEHVKAVFLVQGAIGGSPIADYLNGTGQEPDERMTLVPRKLIQATGAVRVLAEKLVGPGLEGLTRNEMDALWESYDLGNQSIKEISKKFFYIRSKAAPEDSTGLTSHFSKYLSTYYGDNDSLVLLEDQHLEGFGQGFLTFEKATHSDLCVASPISRRPQILRTALMYALLKEVAQAK